MTNEWVKKSNPAYASSMVCVRKKDRSLHLCIDYRMLSNKTIPDRQPTPEVQDMLDCLGWGGGNGGSLTSIRVRHTTKDIFAPIRESIQRFLTLVALLVDLGTLWSEKCSTLFSALHK